MQERQAHLLRRAFLLGAMTDALALIPMLVPSMARLLWGFSNPTGAYQFAMGYGASLMLGWTMLLLWAHRRPIERRFVAALTVLVIYGLVLTEVVAVFSGHLEAWRMVPTWCLQGVLLVLFASAYHHPVPWRRVAV
jgi:peptidoglycan/LPS O-acetylase OafA/YrhL